MRPVWLAALLTLAIQAAETPPRIASFSPAATRILVDLGAGADLVAATRWCDLPAGHPAQRTCDAFEPDAEALRASGASLVILPRLANPMLAERVRSLDLRSHVLASESADSPADDIASLARLTGRTEQGRRLLAARETCRQHPTGKRVLIVSDGVCAGPSSYLAWAIRAAGAEPAPASGAWPEWDIEQVARSKPDVVVYLTDKGPALPEVEEQALAHWRQTPGLRATPAAETGCVYHLKMTSDWLPASGLPAAAATLGTLVRK